LIAQTPELLDQLSFHSAWVPVAKVLHSFLLIRFACGHHVIIDDQDTMSDGYCGSFGSPPFAQTSILLSKTRSESEPWYGLLEPMPSSHTHWPDASARGFRLPALSLWPGHIPAQDARWAASGKRERSSPTSAHNRCRVCRLTPVIFSMRTSLSSSECSRCSISSSTCLMDRSTEDE
jgi:hypothetical protein